MATEPEELWVAAGGAVPGGPDEKEKEPPFSSQVALCPSASVLVDVPQGSAGWPCPGRRFWAGLLCEEGARFLDTLGSLPDDEVAPALFGDEGRPATRLLRLLFYCFGGTLAPAMDWHTWCGTEDPVLHVEDRNPVFVDGDGLADEWIAEELEWCCRRVFPDLAADLRVEIEGDGAFRVGPAPLVRYVPTALVVPVTRADDAPAALPGTPARADRSRKRKAGGLDVAGTGRGGDDGGGGGGRAHGGDGGEVGDGGTGPVREATAPVLAVAVTHAPKRSRKVGH